MFLLIFFTARIFILLSSHSIFLIWVRIEIVNFIIISYLILIKKKNFLSNNWENKFVFKYLIMQTFFSGIIVLIIFFSFYFFLFTFFFFFFFFLKVRSFPRYLWVPEVFINLSFFNIFILRTLSKIPPVFLFFSLRGFNGFVFVFVCLMTVVMSVLTRIKSSNIRVILSFSSVLNIGWFLIRLFFDIIFFFFFFFIYLMFIYFLSILLEKKFIYNYNKKDIILINNFFFFFLLTLSFFRLARLPTSIIFFFKFMIIFKKGYFLFFFFVIIFNSFRFFFYIRILWFNINKKSLNFFYLFMPISNLEIFFFFFLLLFPFFFFFY